MIYRNTIQKTLAIEAAHVLDHPTADEIYTFISEKHPTISRATVYRNLNQMVDAGKLQKVAVPDAADCFDSTLKAHYHIRCRVCGRIADVDLPYQNEIEQQVGNSCGFIIEGHDIIFKGICAGCNML